MSQPLVTPRKTGEQALASKNVIETDTSAWPIVVHRTVGSPPDHQVDAFIVRANQILERRQVHAVIFDNSEAGIPSAYMRRKNMEWLSQRQAALAQHCVGVAFVFPSAAMRFVMSTAMLVWSQPIAHDVFASVPLATTWSEEKVRKGSLRPGA